MSWVDLKVALIHCSMDEVSNRTYQLPPYSVVVHVLDGHRNMMSLVFFFFFFLMVVALGVLLPTLIDPWWHGTYHGHVSYFDWLAGFVSGEDLFIFPAFSKANLFNSSPFTSHLFTFFLCLISLPPLRILLIVSPISFSISKYALYLRFLSFWFYYILFFCAPLFLF